MREGDQRLEPLRGRSGVDRLARELEPVAQVLRVLARGDRPGRVQQDRVALGARSFPAKTARITSAFCSGEPPRSSSGARGAIP